MELIGFREIPYIGSYTYLISSVGRGFPILAVAFFMKALRVRLTKKISVQAQTYGAAQSNNVINQWDPMNS